MKKSLILLALFLTVFGANAQIWRQTIDPVISLPSIAKGYDIQETSDGNYVFAGRLESGNSPNFDYESVLAKLDATTGNILWTKRYPFFVDGNMQEVSLIEKPNGNLLLAGLENNGIFLIETDQNGDTVSTKRILSACETSNGIDCGLATIRLRATLDGNYMIGIGASSQVVGFGIPYPINQILKIDPNHNIIWNKIYGNRFFLDFQPTSDGGYVMSGSTAFFFEPTILKVDMNGDSVWQQNYTGQLMYDLNSIKETPDNGYIVSYNMSGFAGYSPFLMKVDSNGANILWQMPASSALGTTSDVQVDNNGNYIVTGTISVPYGGLLAVMVDAAFVSKIAPNGTMLQTQVFDNLFHNSGTVVRQTNDGNFIMAGSHSITLGAQDKGYVVKTGSLLTTPKIEENNASLELFPNPLETSSTLKLNTEYQELNLLIFDALGRQVAMFQEYNVSQIVVDRNGLEAGIYFFRVLDAERIIGTGKFVVK